MSSDQLTEQRRLQKNVVSVKASFTLQICVARHQVDLCGAPFQPCTQLRAAVLEHEAGGHLPSQDAICPLVPP